MTYTNPDTGCSYMILQVGEKLEIRKATLECDALGNMLDPLETRLPKYVPKTRGGEEVIGQFGKVPRIVRREK